MKINLRKFVTNKLFLVALAALVFAGAGAGGSLYLVKRKPEVLGLAKSGVAAQKETDDLLAQIGKIIALPTDEKPTVATITDISKLKDQPFFKNAKNGDSLLIYTGNARKAIIYRKSENRVIDFGAVNIQGQNNVAGAQSAKFVILNGTKTTGLTKNMEDTLKRLVSVAEVTDKQNAAKSDYQDTLVVDLTGKQSDFVSQLASALGGKVSNLPDGEKKPENVDFVIIVGQNFVNAPKASPIASPSSSPSASPK